MYQPQLTNNNARKEETAKVSVNEREQSRARQHVKISLVSFQFLSSTHKMTRLCLFIALLFATFANSKVIIDDNLRDVRELFDFESVEEIDNDIEEDVIKSLPTFVKNVFKIAKSSTPPPSDSVDLESILETSLGDQYPEFGIDVGINDLAQKLDDSKGFDIVFNIRYDI